jgi:hypothetical protein
VRPVIEYQSGLLSSMSVASSGYGQQRFTKVSLLVALDGGVVCGIEVVEDNTGMRNLNIGLCSAVSILRSLVSFP